MSFANTIRRRLILLVFVVFGTVGFVWAGAWFRWFRDEPADHAIGRSRGGLTTKTHALVDGRGRVLVVIVSPGQAGDSPVLPLLLKNYNGHWNCLPRIADYTLVTGGETVGGFLIAVIVGVPLAMRVAWSALAFKKYTRPPYPFGASLAVMVAFPSVVCG
jgi:hypothetical protein